MTRTRTRMAGWAMQAPTEAERRALHMQDRQPRTYSTGAQGADPFDLGPVNSGSRVPESSALTVVPQQVAAPGWFDDLGRYSDQYHLIDKPQETLSQVPLGGYVRGIGENLGLNVEDALTAERVAAASVAGVGALTMVNAAHGLMNPQTPGTIVIQ